MLSFKLASTLVALLTLSFSINVFSQEIIRRQDHIRVNYYQDSIKLSMNEFNSILKTDSEASELKIKSDRQKIKAFIAIGA